MTWLLIMRRDLKIRYPLTYMLKFSFPHLMNTDTMPMTSATMAQMRTHWGSLRKYEAGYGSGSQSCFHSIFLTSMLFGFVMQQESEINSNLVPSQVSWCVSGPLWQWVRPTEATITNNFEIILQTGRRPLGRMEKQGISFAIEDTLAFHDGIWNTKIWFDLDS